MRRLPYSVAVLEPVPSGTRGTHSSSISDLRSAGRGERVLFHATYWTGCSRHSGHPSAAGASRWLVGARWLRGTARGAAPENLGLPNLTFVGFTDRRFHEMRSRNKLVRSGARVLWDQLVADLVTPNAQAVNGAVHLLEPGVDGDRRDHRVTTTGGQTGPGAKQCQKGLRAQLSQYEIGRVEPCPRSRTSPPGVPTYAKCSSSRSHWAHLV